MKRRDEYEVTVEPTGEWHIDHIRDEVSTRVAYGSAKGPNCMNEAELAARLWIECKLKELERSMDYRSRCWTFTLPATVER